MSIPLYQDDYQKLVTCLISLKASRSVEGRNDLVESSFQGHPDKLALIGELNFSGDTRPFCEDLLRTLADFRVLSDRQEAITVFLQYLLNTQNELAGQRDFIQELVDTFHKRNFSPGQAVATRPAVADGDYYTVDFTAQTRELKTRLSALNKLPNYLVMCVIRGTPGQAGDQFLSQIQDDVLPKSLQLGQMGKIQEFRMDWPARLKNLTDLGHELEINLAKKVLERDANYTIEEIRERLASYPFPVLIKTQMSIPELRRWGSLALKEYLRFWAERLTLGTAQRLFVFWRVEYPEQKKVNFLQRLVGRTPQQEIDRFLEEMQTRPPGGMQPVVLPLLDGADLQEARNWVDSHEDSCQPGPVKKGLDALFRAGQPDEREFIPVEDLATELEVLVKRYPSL